MARPIAEEDSGSDEEENRADDKQRLLKESSFTRPGYGATVDESLRLDDEPRTLTSFQKTFPLLSYATGWDLVQLVVGCFCAIVTGCSFIFTFMVLGDTTDSLMSAVIFEPQPASVNQTFNPDSGISDVELLDYEMVDGAAAFAASMRVACLKFTGLALITVLFSVAKVTLFTRTAQRQANLMAKDLFWSILQRDIAWFDENPSGQVVSDFNDEIAKIEHGLGEKLGLCMTFFVKFVAAVIISAFYSWQITIFAAAAVPIGFLFRRVGVKMAYKRIVNEKEEAAMAVTSAEEAIGGIRVVQSFNGQQHEFQRYCERLEKARTQAVWKEFWLSIVAVGGTVQFLGFGIAMWYCAGAIRSGAAKPGDLIVPLFTVSRSAMALSHFFVYYTAIAEAAPAAAKVVEQLQKKWAVSANRGAGQFPRGRVEFRDVHFSYPSRPHVKALNGVSFVVEPGQSVALVGPSGSGKSTVVKLLLRFYEPDSGQILVDGEDVALCDAERLRSVMGVVSQEPALFDTTVSENIKLGSLDPAVSRADVKAAARAANAHSFISKLPKKYETRVGEKGTQLSGGQKQRVAIARAIVRQPKILLFDEATSALDAENERVVQEALNNVQEGRTSVTVAHRLSTICRSNEILVMSGGVVVERGTHESLLGLGSVYADLVAAQQLEGSAAPLMAKRTSRATSDGEPRRLSLSMAFPHINALMSEDSDSAATTIAESVTMTQQRRGAKDLEDERLRNAMAEEQARPVSFFRMLVGGSSYDVALVVVGFLLATALGFCSSSIGAFLGLFITQSYDASYGTLVGYAVDVILICCLLKALFTVLVYYVFAQLSERAGVRYCSNLFDALLRQDGAYFDDPRHSSGRLVARLTNDTHNVKKALGSHFGMMLTMVTCAAAGTLLSFCFEWRMSFAVAVTLGVALPAAALGQQISAGNRNSGQQRRRAVADQSAADVLAESVRNMRTVRALGAERRLHERFAKHSDQACAAAVERAVRQGLAFGILQTTLTVGFAINFLLGACVIDWFGADSSGVFVVLIIAALGTAGLTQSGSFFADVAVAKASAALLDQATSERPTIDSSTAVGLTPDIVGGLDFKGVSFAYPTRPTVRVLNGFNLSVGAGETVALVGPSGSGKSTLVQLLQRFYDPTSGVLEVDGTDARCLNLQHLRGGVATVAQEPTLFNRSIRENIAYALDHATDEAVRRAAIDANVHDFVVSLPRAYDTVVGEGGSLLSGGQKQRVAIARAIMRDPTILCLDEATAALDSESEKLVQEALERAMRKRTSVLVAHRLSTVRNADRIAVVFRGRVVESGAHAELIMRNGYYAAMVKRQQLAAAEAIHEAPLIDSL